MMELYIETLTGTAFELRVSPFETIMSVKAKIQRLEGIPISQQHLIWQSMELEDDYCLHDYSIHDGATLKLVLAMRGGPINTRRISMEDPALREMAEYMEANRDEILEKLPGNRQVTLLVYREGDQLNFFRVVDRGDGTLTPLSESLSGTSMYNLYDDDDDDESSSKETNEENLKTKEKMQLLRSKMENLTITKKPKKKPIPRPPSTGRPGSHTRTHRLGSSSGRQALGPLTKNPLPPVGQTHTCSNSGSHKAEPPSGLSSVSSVFSANNETPSDIVLPASARRRPDVLDSAKLKRPLSSVKEDSSAAAAAQHHLKVLGKVKNTETLPEASGVTEVTAAGLSTEAAAGAAAAAVTDVTGCCGASSQALSVAAEDCTESARSETVTLKNIAPLRSSAHRHKNDSSENTQDMLLNEMTQTWPATSSTQPFSSRKKDSLNHSLSLRTPTTSSKGLERIFDHNYETALGRPTTTSAASRHSQESLVLPPASKYANLDRKQGLMLESLSQIEARGLLRQASLERLGSSKISSFVRSASKSRAGYHLGSASLKDGSRVTTPEGRLVSARLQRMSASRDGRMLSPVPRLPPVKQKKKASKRCFVCAKKTGLATSYQCRCGNNFCATHRYAESHDCTFDYKTEGRKLLEQNNPVVSAPKLPKI